MRGDPKNDLVELERKKVKEGRAGDKRWLRRKPSHGSVIIEHVDDSQVVRESVNTIDSILIDTFGTQSFTGAALRDLIIEHTNVSRSQAYKTITKLGADGVIIRIGGTEQRPTYQCRPGLADL